MFQFIHKILLMFYFTCFTHDLKFKSFFLGATEVLFFLFEDMFSILISFHPYRTRILTPLLSKLPLLRQTRQRISSYLMNNITCFFESDHFLFLAFFHDLLLLNFIFQHLLRTSPSFLNFFHCFFFFSLEEADSIIQLFSL